MFIYAWSDIAIFMDKEMESGVNILHMFLTRGSKALLMIILIIDL